MHSICVWEQDTVAGWGAGRNSFKRRLEFNQVVQEQIVGWRDLFCYLRKVWVKFCSLDPCWTSHWAKAIMPKFPVRLQVGEVEPTHLLSPSPSLRHNKTGSPGKSKGNVIFLFQLRGMWHSIDGFCRSGMPEASLSPFLWKKRNVG